MYLKLFILFFFYRNHLNEFYLENLISNLNDELDKLKKALRECLDSSKVNKDDITVS